MNLNKNSTVKVKRAYFKDSDGNEGMYEYNEEGKLLYTEDPIDGEIWYEYNEDGRLVHSKDSGGLEIWHDYNDDNTETHTKDSEGFEFWYKYDEKANLIHSRFSNGFEVWYDYDEAGKLIHSKTSEYAETSKGLEIWYDYDEKGNEIHSKDSEGNESWHDYDEKGNETHYKNSGGFEVWYEHNENNNLIHVRYLTGLEEWYEYELFENNKDYTTETDSLEERYDIEHHPFRFKNNVNTDEPDNIFGYDTEMINYWWKMLIETEIDEIKGTISNEHLMELGYDGEELNPHTQNICNLQEYLRQLISYKKKITGFDDCEVLYLFDIQTILMNRRLTREEVKEFENMGRFVYSVRHVDDDMTIPGEVCPYGKVRVNHMSDIVSLVDLQIGDSRIVNEDDYSYDYDCE